MAAVCWAWTRRLAMVWRRRLIGTRFSGRSPSTTGAAAGAAAPPAGLAAFLALPSFTARCTSSLRIRPPLPVPSIFSTSRSCSATSLRAAGARILPPTFSSLAPSSAEAAGFSSPLVAGLAPPPAPSVKTASTCSEVTWLPSSAWISDRAPSAGATTSRTTLSVSISASTSSRLTASPTCLAQLATVPSWMDSGKVGALTSWVLPPPAGASALVSLFGSSCFSS